MDEFKKGSKTLLDFFFKAYSVKKCKSNKGLDSPTIGPSTNNPSCATSSSEISESYYLCSDEKFSDSCPASKWLIRQKRNKLILNG